MQYNAFDHYFKEMGHKYSVPKPYGFLKEYSTLIVEWIDYKDMGQSLWQFNHRFSDRASFIERSGIWLKEFHKISSIKKMPYNTAIRINKINDLLENVTGLRKLHIKQPIFKNAYRLLQECSKEFDGIELKHTTIHGDFTPNNLLTGERFIGIDFNRNIQAPAILDIIRFLMYLDIYRKFLTKKSSLLKYGCNKKDFEAFMLGYGGYDKELSIGFIYYVQLEEVLRRFVSLCTGRKARGVNKIYRFVELYRLFRMIKYISRSLSLYMDNSARNV